MPWANNHSRRIRRRSAVVGIPGRRSPKCPCRRALPLCGMPPRQADRAARCRRAIAPRSGQGFGNARTKLGLQRGQHGFAYPPPGKPAICVVWVLPRVESLLCTGLLGRFTAEVKEWPQQVPGPGWHPGQ